MTQSNTDIIAQFAALAAPNASQFAFSAGGGGGGGDGYDAGKPSGRRRAPSSSLKSEDDTLRPEQRRKVIATARDLVRNMAVAAWAVRKHLDYVASFAFQCRTGDRKLDQQITDFVDWWSEPENFDVAGRHSLYSATRILERRATVDGDCGWMRIANGLTQGMEGDRIRTPTRGVPANFQTYRLQHGVRTDKAGKALAYVICDRDRGGFTYRMTASAQNVWLHGYFDRFDQVRGVGPLTSALTTFQDVAETQVYALAKAKVAQFFGVKFKRDSDEPVAAVTGGGTDAEGNPAPPYKFDFGAGPQVLDLEPGDDAEFMHADAPGAQTMEFMKQMLGDALKALDIPISFYDENHAAYSGSRSATLHYEQGAKEKRRPLQRGLINHTRWRLSLAVLDGKLKLPAGMTVAKLPIQWIPTGGVPWMDPLKEVKAEIEAVNNQLRSRQEIALSRGKNWYQVLDELAEESAELTSRGLTVPAPAGANEPDPEDEPKREGQK